MLWQDNSDNIDSMSIQTSFVYLEIIRLLAISIEAFPQRRKLAVVYFISTQFRLLIGA